MRKTLKYDGWLDNSELPDGWKMKQAKQNTYLMDRGGELFKSFLEAAKFIETYVQYFTQEDVDKVNRLARINQPANSAPRIALSNTQWVEGKLLTWMPDDLEEEDVTRSVSEESLEVPVADNAQTEDTTDFTIQRMSCELPTDRSEVMDGTNDEPDEEIDKVHVKSMLNSRIVGTDSRTYLDEAGTP